MNITILGTGMVGQSIASKMTVLGHKVIMGTRNPEETIKRTEPNQMTGISFAEWYKENSAVELRSLPESAQNADLIINAANGQATLDVLAMVGEKTLEGKILLDIANPLDFSNGMPPTLFVCNTNSLGEQIQSEFPKTKVVKSLNTMNTYIMMHPESIPGNHSVFVSGNDTAARGFITDLLQSIGWKKDNIIDLGDITTARGTEMLLPIWVRLWGAFGNANFNFHIQKAD